MNHAELAKYLLERKPPLDIHAVFDRATEIARRRYPDGVSSASILGDIVTEAINVLAHESSAQFQSGDGQ